MAIRRFGPALASMNCAAAWRPAFDRDLHVLDHRLAGRELPPGHQGVTETMTPVEGDQLAVDVTAPVTTRPQPPDHRLLHTEGARAPEPVGIPPPQVVPDGEKILLVAPDRFVVDLLAGVIAAPRRDVAERPDREVELIGPEGGPVDEIRPVAAKTSLRGDLGHRVQARLRGAEREMAQVHERLNRFQFDREREGVAQGAVDRK